MIIQLYIIMFTCTCCFACRPPSLVVAPDGEAVAEDPHEALHGPGNLGHLKRGGRVLLTEILLPG